MAFERHFPDRATANDGSAPWEAPESEFDLELSDDGGMVIFRAYTVGQTPDSFVRRHEAIVAFADRQHVSSVLLDYRRVNLPVDPGFVESVVHGPGSPELRKWHVAILVREDGPGYSLGMAEELVEIFRAMGQNARVFHRYGDAIIWLDDSARQSKDA